MIAMLQSSNAELHIKISFQSPKSPFHLEMRNKTRNAHKTGRIIAKAITMNMQKH